MKRVFQVTVFVFWVSKIETEDEHTALCSKHVSMKMNFKTPEGKSSY